jgi:hypothetical protein
VAVFNWCEANYQADVAQEPDLRPYFLLALSLLSDIEEKRAEILSTPGADHYQQMRYPIELPSSFRE